MPEGHVKPQRIKQDDRWKVEGPKEATLELTVTAREVGATGLESSVPTKPSRVEVELEEPASPGLSEVDAARADHTLLPWATVEITPRKSFGHRLQNAAEGRPR